LGIKKAQAVKPGFFDFKQPLTAALANDRYVTGSYWVFRLIQMPDHRLFSYLKPFLIYFVLFFVL
jgi:hypothetical protein